MNKKEELVKDVNRIKVKAYKTQFTHLSNNFKDSNISSEGRDYLLKQLYVLNSLIAELEDK